MANISNEVNVHNGAEVTNWISQIKAGETTYDIATHHSIIFKDGSNDKDGIVWNGLSDLEVVIPSITDIVQSPIVFAGTVDAEGVKWNETHTDGPKEGYLVFVTTDCTFAGNACEAGDMAIYDGSKWNIVSGENQVKITGTTNEDITEGNRTVVAIGAAKDVLEVEGKALALTLDYADLNGHVTKTPGGEVAVNFGDMTVSAVSLKLEQAKPETKTIGNDVEFQNATALANGTVTLTNADSLVSAVDFGTFDAGTLPTFKKNVEKTLSVTGGELTATTGSDFVTNVTLGDVLFTEAGEGDANKITMITDITAKAGSEFLNGIKPTGAGENADITITGCIAPTKGTNATFIEGLTNGATKVVTEITAGNFELTAGDALVTGFEDGSDDVIASVTATANNDTDVFSSAKVTDHVLSFETTKVASGVNVSTTTKKLTKTGFTYTAPKATDSTFETSGFTQSADVKYTFTKATETTYTPTTEMWKISKPQLTVDKGAYEIKHDNMIATVTAGTFIESATEGTLPSWTGGDTTKVKVEGTVGTALSTTTMSIKELTVDSIDIPGAYTLKEVSEGGDVTVGAAGDINVGDANVNLVDYVKDITIA